MLEALDTIVAIATPPGRGGLGIVRLSGPRARAIAEPLLRLRNPLAPGQARFGHIVDPASGAALDEVVATFFAAPHSYTAEDVVEIAAHGAPVLLDFLLRAALAGGARLAEPGEFTRRAFLSGRLDLTAAEAVHDLVEASTLEQARVAAAQLDGSLARAVLPAKQQLLELIAALEAGVDFAEDDVDLLPQAEILARLAAVASTIGSLADSFGYGRLLRSGFSLAIVGRPNAGKSSLFNRLLERPRAIVTAHPGTTRDPITEPLSLAGIPVQLIDTAGLRDAPAGPEHEAESEGIRRSRAALAEADFALLVIDAATREPDRLHAEDARTLGTLAGRPCLIVYSKVDLLEPALQAEMPAEAVACSAVTGDGVERLRQRIVAGLTEGAPAAETALVTNLRQHTALTEGVAALTRAATAAHANLPHELLLLDLYAALESLDSLTGATTSDDILGRIFATFCIGK